MHPTGKTGLIGLLAHPIAHVRAPGFMNPVFAELGRDCQVVPLHVQPDDLRSAIDLLKKVDNVRGIILSIPHKEAAKHLCDDLGAHGRLCGSVNAVRFTDGGTFGDMFDGVGLLIGQRKNGIDVTGRRILVVGAGGAARAIVFAYGQAGASYVQIANRTFARAERLATEAKAALPDFDVAAGPADPTDFDLVVNATPMGISDNDPLPIEIGRLSSDTDVIDVIAVRDTELLQTARKRGCRTIDGMPMALGQLKAFVDFFDPPKSV